MKPVTKRGCIHPFLLAFFFCLPFILSTPRPTDAQITIPDTVPRDTPIIGNCNCVVPDGAELKVRWTLTSVTPGAKSEMIEVGNGVHVWAGPGTHQLIASVVWLQFEEVEVPTTDGGTRIIRNLLAWDSQTYDQTFTVEGEDNPNPNPNPNPGPDPPPPSDDFEGMILEALEAIGNPPSKTKVADVYANVAEEANNRRDIYSPAVMVDAAKTQTSTALTLDELQTWQSFWPTMNEAFASLEMEANDTDAFIEAFRNFADILKQ